MEVNDENFEAEVKNSDKPVVLDAYAEWCGPCRMLAPVFEQVSGEMGDVKFVKLNVDEAQGVASNLGIRSIPCLVIFKGGEEVARTTGAKSADDLKAWITSSLS